MSNMTNEERELYFSDVKAKSDWTAGIRFAEKKAKIEGIKEGRIEGKAEGLEEGRIEGLEEGRIEGKAEGKAEGLEAGKTEAKINMAKLLKQKMMPIHDIADITGLSFREIELL